MLAVLTEDFDRWMNIQDDALISTIFYKKKKAMRLHASPFHDFQADVISLEIWATPRDRPYEYSLILITS